MWDVISPRLEELARRAGVGGAPPAAVAAVLVVCVLAAGWAAWRWWPQEAQNAEPVAFSQSEAHQESTEPTGEPAAKMLVHVVGAVRRPGVYELASGSRVVDAVEAAGGVLPDALVAQVNLARPATDGEQIHVPSEDDPVPSAGTGGAAGSAPGLGSSGGIVDINTADAAALDSLPGVGPSTAEKIIAEREKNGPFTSLEDLSRVSGIGPKKIEQLTGLAGVR